MLLSRLARILALSVLSPAAMAAYTLCTGIVSGEHDNVIVPPGSACQVQDARVAGHIWALEASSLLVLPNVNVGASIVGDHAASVVVINVTVEGDIVIADCVPPDPATQTTSAAEVEGSRIRGSINVERCSGGSILIGNGGGNQVGGTIQVRDSVVPGNRALWVLFNTVGGNLALFDDPGGFDKMVFGNAVNGVLWCQGIGAPFYGGGNASGLAGGQCF
jgi:hypothetical protein